MLWNTLPGRNTLLFIFILSPILVTPSWANLIFDVTPHLGTAEIHNNSSQLFSPTKGLLAGIDAFVGMSFPNFFLAFHPTYQLLKQTSEITDKNEYNFSGKNTMMGVALGYLLGPLSLSYTYNLYSKYELDQVTAKGEATYFDDVVGHLFKLKWKLSGRYFLDLSYGDYTYKNQNLSGSEFNISNNELHVKTYAIGIGIDLLYFEVGFLDGNGDSPVQE